MRLLFQTYLPFRVNARTATIFVAIALSLAGCTVTGRSKPMLDDISAVFDADGNLIYSVPGKNRSKICQLNLGTGATLVLSEPQVPVVGLFADSRRRIFFEGRWRTPRDLATVQVFVSGSDPDRFDLVSGVGESLCSSLVGNGDAVYYLKSTTYGGASSGTPWLPPYALCEWAHGRESTVHTLSNDPSLAPLVDNGKTVPLLSSWGDGSCLLSALELQSGNTREVGRFKRGSTFAVSADGRRAAIGAPLATGPDSEVMHVDFISGKVTATTVLSGRLTRLLFAPNGDLYGLTEQTGSGMATLHEFRSTRWVAGWRLK